MCLREKQTGGWQNRIVNGQEMAEGSDGSGSELEMEYGGGRDEGWNVVKGGKAKRKRKEREQKGRTSVSEETDSEQAKKGEEEHKIIITLEQEGASFGEWNPVRITKAINKQVGEVKSAKVLRSGALLVFCRDSAQLGRAIRLNKIEGKKVLATLAKSGGGLARGVIFGIPEPLVDFGIQTKLKKKSGQNGGGNAPISWMPAAN
ncbi:uncharacterized protein LOC131969355 [Centropristis striata]|uniref:uncharacterized protein LOC131969355 n=1 Tax=Centropristis striata TaxID=184440 RepID=UPI0027E1AF0C|nr:uncharacterized protein LOC131969355 [Centropristis striata]